MNQKSKCAHLLLALSLVVAATGCSTYKRRQRAQAEAAAQARDAATDAVPAADAESLEVADSAPAPLQVKLEPGAFEEHEIKSGETLMRIAYETYGDLYRWRQIVAANQDRITSLTKLVAGTKLRLPKLSSRSPASASPMAGSPFVIRLHDTLQLISRDIYGTTRQWSSLYDNNRGLIRDPNHIFAGFTIYYLGAAGPRAPASVGVYGPQPLRASAPKPKRR